MSTTLRAILVGISGRGRWPLREATRERGFEVVAVCDVSEAALAEARETAGLDASACFTDLDEALKRVDADCCIICTPTRFHVPMTIQAVDAGLAVLVEKGMAPNWDEARRLIEHVERADAKVCIAQNYRYQGAPRAIHRLLHDTNDPHHPGDVFLINYTQHRVRPHVRTLDYPFASVWDMSCHHFDTLLSWIGPVRQLTARSFAAPWSEYPHDNNTSIFLEFANGTVVDYIHTHDASRGELNVNLHGQRGAVYWNSDGIAFSERPTEQFGSRPAVPIEPDEPAGETSVLGVLADFHRYVTRDVEPGISARHNLEVMALCEMTVRACTDRRTVRREELTEQGASAPRGAS